MLWQRLKTKLPLSTFSRRFQICVNSSWVLRGKDKDSKPSDGSLCAVDPHARRLFQLWDQILIKQGCIYRIYVRPVMKVVYCNLRHQYQSGKIFWKLCMHDGMQVQDVEVATYSNTFVDNANRSWFCNCIGCRNLRKGQALWHPVCQNRLAYGAGHRGANQNGLGLWRKDWNDGAISIT